MTRVVMPYLDGDGEEDDGGDDEQRRHGDAPAHGEIQEEGFVCDGGIVLRQSRGDALRGDEACDGQSAALHAGDGDGKGFALRRPSSANLLRSSSPLGANLHLFVQLGGSLLNGSLSLFLRS